MDPSALRADDQPLTDAAIQQLMDEVPEWDLVQEGGADKLRRTFEFRNFAEALGFTNRVGELAEEHRHHPIITVTWGRATITWYTHDINGLRHNDFKMAARTAKLYSAP